MVAGVAATRLKYHLRPVRAALDELEVAAVVVRALADDRSDGRSRIDNWRVVIRRSFTRTCSTADIFGYCMPHCVINPPYIVSKQDS